MIHSLLNCTLIPRPHDLLNFPLADPPSSYGTKPLPPWIQTSEGGSGSCRCLPPSMFQSNQKKKSIILLNAKLRLWFPCSNYTTNLLKGHSTNFYTSRWVYLCVSCYFSTVHCQLKTHTKTSCSNSRYYLVKWHRKSRLIRLMYVLTHKFRMSYQKYF